METLDFTALENSVYRLKEVVEKYKEKWTNNVGLMNGLVIDE